MAKRPKVFGHLLIEVIRPERCVACGSCVSVCPVDAISFVDGTPKLTGKCTACGACYISCPRSEHDFKELEAQALGRSRKENETISGVVLEAYAVRTLDNGVKSKAQDGGAVTSILLNYLGSGGEGVVVAGLDDAKTWSPVPVFTKDSKKVIECAGTKYTSTPMLLAVKEASKNGLSNVAIVGTPCQAHAMRRRSEEKGKLEPLLVGLFCMETFDYGRLVDYLRSENVDPTWITKFEIKSGKFIAKLKEGGSFEVKIRKLKDLSRKCCTICQDYTSELADLSVGNVGSPEGWSTVLVRTKKGFDALKAAEKSGLVEIKPLSDFQPGMSLVDRLSDMKKKENSGKS